MILVVILVCACIWMWLWVKLVGNFPPGRERRLAVAVGVAIIAIFAVAALFVAIKPN